MPISFWGGDKAVYSVLCGLLLGLTPIISLQAQGWELGTFTGFSFYHGELTPVNHLEYYRLLRPAGGLSLRYAPVPEFGIRLGAAATTLHGNSRYSPFTIYGEQEIAMRTPARELSLTAEFAPFVIRWWGGAVRPLVYTGIAVLHYRPQLYFEGRWVETQTLGTEGQGLPGNPAPYATRRTVLPLGAALRIALNRRLVLGLELHARLPFTDYLDDISGRPVDYALLRSQRGEFVARLSHPTADEQTGEYRRGNPGRDAYFFTGLGFYYRLERSGWRQVRCPEW